MPSFPTHTIFVSLAVVASYTSIIIFIADLAALAQLATPLFPMVQAAPAAGGARLYGLFR